jgi:hypothetical protein
MARNNSKASAVRRWHRFFGAAAALFVAFMVLTGLSINHSHSLGLDRTQVSHPFLLGWYGLGEPENLRSYAVGSDWLSFAGSQLYLNDNAVASISDGVGAVSNGDLLIAAGRAEILLLDRAGNLIERQPWGPPGAGRIDALGQLENGAVVVRAARQLWLADAEILNWRQSEGLSVTPLWSSAGTTPGALRQAIVRQYRGNGLSLERILLDLHSGRIFGTAGVIIYDILALAVGFLAISGLVLWLRGRRNGNQNGKRKEQ